MEAYECVADSIREQNDDQIIANLFELAKDSEDEQTVTVTREM